MHATRSEEIPRLVVGFDGSEASEEALEWASVRAEATGAVVEVVTTWCWPSGYGAAVVVPSGYDPAGDARSLVTGAVVAARSRHPGVGFVPVVVEGHPATALVEASQGAELLALGSRGHGEVTGLLLGSVSEHCAAHARCPVLIVPARAAGGATRHGHGRDVTQARSA